MANQINMPTECKDGAWITLCYRSKDEKWGFAWRTRIMRCNAFWYFDSRKEAMQARLKFIKNHGGRA